MINEIIVTDLSDAERYSFNPNNKNYDVWISTVDRDDTRKINRMRTNFDNKGVRYCSQFFYDWSDEDGDQWKHLETEGPQLHHIQNIISFLKPVVEDNKLHNVGINCFAGISRSTAVAIIALVMSGKTIDDALDYVLAIRPEAWPNLRILGFASQILKKDIKNCVVRWKQNCLNSSEIFTMPDRKRTLGLD